METDLDWKETVKNYYRPEQILFDEPMAKHTTFRIGGPAECYVIPDDAEQIRKTVALADEAGVPCHIIGNGSNLLVSDDGVPGIVIRMEENSWEKTGTAEDGRDCFRVSAGSLFSSFAKVLCRDGYTGLEFATGIPGSIGGAVVMNAGAYGGEVKDVLVSADVLTKSGKILTVPASELDLSYRHSNIDENGYTVLSAVFAVKKSEDPEAVSGRVAELSEKRKEKQPLEYPSAGSTFKRPEGYFAGKLIDDCGLRGYRVGDAQVSEKHCGFVINRGNATAEDVMQLISAVQRKVMEQFGILLEPEVRFLGF
ncbi:MAG: UDP-N-acetylmuramate dehydrogenase [Lachnospiraceae bacterium]|nr:UDP-N-acetylmuramate dehydrogenase [Lachnospiraceae bacterium]